MEASGAGLYFSNACLIGIYLLRELGFSYSIHNKRYHRQQRNNTDRTERGYAVDAPHAENVFFDMSKIHRKRQRYH